MTRYRKKRKMSRKKCPATGKTMIKTEKEAERIRFRIWSHDSKADIYDMHVYVCPKCRHYHVGHKSKYENKLRRMGND